MQSWIDNPVEPQHSSNGGVQSSNQNLAPRLLSRLLHQEGGQDLIEYALVAGVIGLAAVASAHGVAVSVSSAINIVSNELTSAI